jgi:uncharacterized protein (TIGR00369 family)
MPPSEARTPQEIAAQRQGIIDYFHTFAFTQLMGMKLMEIEPGRSRISMSWRPDLTQPAGIMHGGAIASLVDTAIAHAILLTLPDTGTPTTGGRIVTLDLRIKYLRPVSAGQIFCDARIVRAGRQIIHADAIVKDEEGKEVALGDSIYMIVKGENLQKK